MSDFIRRASDALHHRQRQDSTDSTDSTKSPDAGKPLDQEPLSQNPVPIQSDAQGKETSAGTATSNVPKQRRRWAWGHYQARNAENKDQRSQEQRDDIDWVIGS